MSFKESTSTMLMDKIAEVSHEIRAIQNIYDNMPLDLKKCDAYVFLSYKEALLKDILKEVMNIDG